MQIKARCSCRRGWITGEWICEADQDENADPARCQKEAEEVEADRRLDEKRDS